jgi:prepilin-type N-terminal cleavage/methylation domain-containing protein
MMRKRQAAFSLIELLIVVAIILIIAAIAIPSFLNSRMSANEASAVAAIRTISTAETAYATSYASIGYSNALIDLGDGGSSNCVAISTRACLLDSILASGIKSGYSFTYVNDGNTPSIAYTVHADPTLRGGSGRRSFFSNEPGVIRFNNAAAATLTDPPI